MRKVLGALLLLSISTAAAKVARSKSETYSITPDSYLTAVCQTVTGVTGDIVCGHMCMTAEPHFCVAYPYCHLPAFGNGRADSNCRIYQNSSLFVFFDNMRVYINLSFV